MVGFMLVPMQYHLPVGNIDNEFSMIWYSWFIEHIVDSNDAVNLEIASYGGDVFIGYRLVNALNSTDAHTIAKVKSIAASMAAIITISCDEIQADEYTSIMFHKADSGFVKINMPIVDNLIKDKLFPIVSQDIRDKYNNGEDVWFNGKIFAEAFNRNKRKGVI
jgi:hypothetical protein